jgi:DNA-binding MltR family transcriptional regulator
LNLEISLLNNNKKAAIYACFPCRRTASRPNRTHGSTAASLTLGDINEKYMEKEKSNHVIISGKVLERHFDFNNALFAFHELFNLDKKDERSIAILGGTFLEMALEHTLKAFLPENEKEVDRLFEYNQPLGNFSSKISLAFCLGLIDKMIKEDLNTVRKIRNKFAHDLYADFDDNQIKAWCNNLRFHKISMMMDPPEGSSELDIFRVGVNQLISNLHGSIGISRIEKRHVKDDLGQFE